MYCRNCGQPLGPGAAFCSRCGTAAGQGAHYCPHCGQAVQIGRAVCDRCGGTLNAVPDQNCARYPATAYPEQKSRIAAGVLGILLGALGIHNFYLGYTGRGLAQLLITLCTCGIGGVAMQIWALVEGILLLCGNVQTDAKGVPLKD